MYMFGCVHVCKKIIEIITRACKNMIRKVLVFFIEKYWFFMLENKNWTVLG